MEKVSIVNFDLTEEQTLLRDLVEWFLADRYDPIRRLSYVAEPQGFPMEMMVGQAFKRTTLLAALLGDADWDLRHYVRLTAGA